MEELRLQFDSAHRALLITVVPMITQESVVAARSAVRLFLKVHDPQSVIADLSLVERIDVPTDFILRIAADPPALAPGIPCILVAPKDATYGMSRMFQILRKMPSLQVVHSMKEALELL